MARRRPPNLFAAPSPRDAALAALIAAALLLDGALGHEGEGVGVAAVAAVGLATVPLAWRTRVPEWVLVLVIAGVFACLFTLKPVNTIVLAPMLAAYTVALGGHRGRSLVVGGFSVAVALVAVFAASGRTRDVLYNPCLMAVAVAAGDAVRSRRAVEEAARLREAERAGAAERDAQRRVLDERVRIAQEVHDVVAHAMVAINVQAGVAAHLLGPDATQARSALTEIKRVSGASLDDLRATLGVLREEEAPVLPTGGLEQLPELAAPLRTAGIAVELSCPADAAAVPAPVGAAVYRIAQEALTNVLRHAGASAASVRVSTSEDGLLLDVLDDGAALPAPAVPAGSGNGLRGMRERATAMGGTLAAGPDPAGGWRVQAALPLR